ncbi:hypothetical protein N7449_000489 [Penicillium cf. viridicatum]|uniref:Thioredoxin n=1 Tax=Penicillium cf. viridicatum TaxID=2972119 RepID=A0A9W9T9C3_9EURO|nr:hypothetical protein N7449_000489 [Penicillium cf. viridicatum]
MEVFRISSKAEYSDALNTENLVVIHCFATWSGPCRVMSQIFSRFPHEYPQVRFHDLDVDAVPSVAEELGIRSLPSVFVFRKGEMVEGIVGSRPAAVKDAIEKYIALG